MDWGSEGEGVGFGFGSGFVSGVVVVMGGDDEGSDWVKGRSVSLWRSRVCSSSSSTTSSSASKPSKWDSVVAAARGGVKERERSKRERIKRRTCVILDDWSTQFLGVGLVSFTRDRRAWR